MAHNIPNLDYASFKPFYFYDLSWALVPVYEFCQFASGAIFIFRSVTSHSKRKIQHIITEILLGFLLTTSWLPLVIYNSMNSTLLIKLQSEDWRVLFESNSVVASENVLNWFVFVKILQIGLRSG